MTFQSLPAYPQTPFPTNLRCAQGPVRIGESSFITALASVWKTDPDDSVADAMVIS